MMRTTGIGIGFGGFLFLFLPLLDDGRTEGGRKKPQCQALLFNIRAYGSRVTRSQWREHVRSSAMHGSMGHEITVELARYFGLACLNASGYTRRRYARYQIFTGPIELLPPP